MADEWRREPVTGGGFHLSSGSQNARDLFASAGIFCPADAANTGWPEEVFVPSAEHCRALADEADRLANVVSYMRDKARLREQAETWRIKARALEEDAAIVVETEVHGVLAWWRRRRA